MRTGSFLRAPTTTVGVPSQEGSRGARFGTRCFGRPIVGRGGVCRESFVRNFVVAMRSSVFANDGDQDASSVHRSILVSIRS